MEPQRVHGSRILGGVGLMTDQIQLRVVLLPDGRLAMPETSADPLLGEGRWETLGGVRHDGERMTFVRAELANVSWAALVRSDQLEPETGGALVTLRRQSHPHPPLSGWSRFC